MIIRLDKSGGNYEIRTLNLLDESEITSSELVTYLPLVVGLENEVFFVNKNPKSKKYNIMCISQLDSSKTIIT